MRVQLVQLSCLSVGDVISPLSSSPIAKHSPSPRRAEWRREELQILKLLAFEEQKRTTKGFHPHPKLSGSSVSALRALTLPLCRRCVPLQACRGYGICAGTEPSEWKCETKTLELLQRKLTSSLDRSTRFWNCPEVSRLSARTTWREKLSQVRRKHHKSELSSDQFIRVARLIFINRSHVAALDAVGRRNLQILYLRTKLPTQW